jgi:glycosyltransferase involved in cell wall biosynthesis
MVSVIIPSYNSEKTIEKCLTALQTQTFDGEYEIIVVDSSDDRTPLLVKKHFPKIQYIHLPEKTDPGTARNLGIRKSKGDPLLFIDSDCQASPDWIEQIVSLHKTTDYEAVGGSVLNGNDHKSNIAWASYLAEFREFIPQRPRREVDHIPTCNISYKRSVFDQLKGFNPKYYPQEDLEFNHRLKKNGGKILFNPQAYVYHHHRTTLRSFFNHQKMVGFITSTMLKILPLEGSAIARSRVKTLLAIPFLPLVKWMRTLSVFWKLHKQIILKHPLAVIILLFGMLPWAIGFLKGVYSNNHLLKESRK